MKKEARIKNQPKKPVKKKKTAKWITIAAIAVAVVLCAALLLPKLLSSGDASARTVTYNVEAITYGSVSTTISGSGNLSPVSKQTFSAEYDAEITAVGFTVGDEVAEDDVIVSLTYTVVDRFGNESTEDAEITAPFDGILIELPVSEGGELAQGDTICMIMGKDGFVMSVSVDELNISNVALGQDVKYTVDALSVSYTGKVTAISYNGSTSGSATTYKIETTLDYIEGVYPGMSASAVIVIEDSGDGLLVPVDAVYTSGDESYVYLAPSGDEIGTEYAEEALDLTKLTKATVAKGMSDGSYIMIESDSLAQGDGIIVKKVTSAATGSDSDSRSGREFPGGSGFDFGGDFGGSFPSGGFPGGGSGFDPSNRPSGGFGGN